jgi:FkbM family methyltransferase
VFQRIPHYFDPIIRWRLPRLSKPTCLRLVSHSSIIARTAQEESITQTFAEVVRTLPSDGGGVFWDIGANIGCYTWLCASIRPDFAIVSFEPDSKNLECLRRTSQAWRLPRHEIVPQAVARSTGRAVFYPDDITGSTGALESDNATFNAIHYEAVPRKMELETVSLDDFNNGHQSPTVIKIDIEGSELVALQGGANLLKQSHPVLFLETYSKRAEIFRYLIEFGYRVFDSDRRQEVTTETINIVAVTPFVFPPAMTA